MGRRDTGFFQFALAITSGNAENDALLAILEILCTPSENLHSSCVSQQAQRPYNPLRSASMNWESRFQAVAEWAAKVLVSWCWRRYQCRVQDVEDAVQDALGKAWEHRHAFRGNTDAEFRSWLMMTARNALISGFRKSNRIRGLQVLTTEPVAAPTDETNEVQDELRRARRELPSELSELVRLYYDDDLTMQEVANRTGVAVSTVHNRHRRALVLLHESLMEKML
jgi:RNA polymerase sigma factor (sigma-70 family)